MAPGYSAPKQSSIRDYCFTILSCTLYKSHRKSPELVGLVRAEAAGLAAEVVQLRAEVVQLRAAQAAQAAQIVRLEGRVAAAEAAVFALTC